LLEHLFNLFEPLKGLSLDARFVIGETAKTDLRCNILI